MIFKKKARQLYSDNQMYDPPKIDLQNLTAEGRLQKADYEKALGFFRRLAAASNGLVDEPYDFILAQKVSVKFMSELPEKDSASLLETIVNDVLEI